jgi:hypothetical protein
VKAKQKENKHCGMEMKHKGCWLGKHLKHKGCWSANNAEQSTEQNILLQCVVVGFLETKET